MKTTKIIRAIYCTIIALLIQTTIQAQKGIGTNSPNTAAALDISSTNKGVLIPRIALTDALAAAPLNAHVAGMLVYNTATVASAGAIVGVTPGFYYNNGTRWLKISDATGVDLKLIGNGNHITSDAGVGSNGTSIGTGLNNIAIGVNVLSGNTTGTGNTAVGTNALQSNMTANGNVAIGFGSGLNTTSGGSNTMVGLTSGNQNTTGQDNTFIGGAAGNQNTTGLNNTYIGRFSGRSGTATSNNTFLGYGSGQNATVANSTFIGYQAGNIATGASNTFLGYQSGLVNTTGDRNTFIGSTSGLANTSGARNTFIGNNSGTTNTTGGLNVFVGESTGAANTVGTGNTFLGARSGRANTTGIINSFFGNDAGINTTTGNSNVFFGSGAGTTNTTESNNVFIGTQAGRLATSQNSTFIGYQSGNITTGVNNTFIGYQTGIANTTGGFNLAIGNNVDVVSPTASNQMNIGGVIFGTGVNEVTGSAISSGNIGIGTATPNERLEVNGKVRISNLTGTDAATDVIVTADATTGELKEGGALTFTKTGTVVSNGNSATLSTEDFVFGSSSLDDIAGTGDDSRMFFDKSKGAFRAGFTIFGTEYNDANVGAFSVGFSGATASNIGSVGIGFSSESLAVNSVTLGTGTHAASNRQISIGSYNTQVVGTLGNSNVLTERLFVIGNGTNTASRSDALVMLKSGNTTLNGDLTTNGSLHLRDFVNLKPGTAPVAPNEGDIYYDAALKKVRVWTGASWENLN
jgi:hypothetical protein